MLAKLLQRLPRGGPDVEVGVATPIGCLVPLAAMLVVVIAVGIVVGLRLQSVPEAPREAILRVIDDGAEVLAALAQSRRASLQGGSVMGAHRPACTSCAWAASGAARTPS